MNKLGLTAGRVLGGKRRKSCEGTAAESAGAAAVSRSLPQRGYGSSPYNSASISCTSCSELLSLPAAHVVDLFLSRVSTCISNVWIMDTDVQEVKSATQAIRLDSGYPLEPWGLILDNQNCPDPTELIGKKRVST